MAINKGTLGKLIDGIVQYIYPKTTADIVEYDKSQSVQQKIESIDKNIDNVNNRVTTITSGITAGNIQTKNDAELFDIRNPNINVVPKGTTYTSAGEAVRGQFGSLSDKKAKHIYL